MLSRETITSHKPMKTTTANLTSPSPIFMVTIGMVCIGIIEGMVLATSIDFALIRHLIPIACYGLLGCIIGLSLWVVGRRVNLPPWMSTVMTVAFCSLFLILIKESIVLEGGVLSVPSMAMAAFALTICVGVALVIAWLFASGRITFSVRSHLFLVSCIFLLLFGVVEHVVYVGVTPSVALAIVHVLLCGVSMIVGTGVVTLVYRITEEGWIRDAASVASCVVLFVAIATFGPHLHTQRALAHYRYSLPTRLSMIEAKAGRPDIILIVADTLRKDRVSAYCTAHVTTPAIDSLAHDGVLFNNVTTVAPWTTPSHASIFTGLYSSEHHANNSLGGDHIGYPLDQHAVTLAEVLYEQGYRTGAVVANYSALSPYYNMQQGFEFYYCRTLFPPISVWGNIFFTCGHEPYRLLGTNQIETVPQLMPIILRWIQKDRSRPFFLFINFMEPHGMEYIPSPVNKVIPYTLTVPPRADLKGQEQFHQQLLQRKDMVKAWYDNEVAWFDLQFGLFLAELKRNALYDPSWIIFLSDHGEMLGEHDYFGHERGLYEELLQVPLIFKYPHDWKVRQGPSEAHLELVDLMPEILSTLAIPQPIRVSGRVFTEAGGTHHAELYPFPQYREDGYLVSFQEERFKLIKSTQQPPLLFDLFHDPKELHNLSEIDIARRTLLEGRITDWFTSLTPIQRSKEKGSMPEDLRRGLKSLGYIQ